MGLDDVSEPEAKFHPVAGVMFQFPVSAELQEPPELKKPREVLVKPMVFPTQIFGL